MSLMAAISPAESVLGRHLSDAPFNTMVPLPLILRERTKIKKAARARACDHSAKASNL
jgi:hypothetical protein